MIEEKRIPLPKESGSLRFLYGTLPGRCILKLLTSRWISILCGKYLDSPASKRLIDGFITKNNIPMEEYEEENYTCFNDCFCRKIKPQMRPIDQEKSHLIAPCDGLLSVYPIEDTTIFPVKQSMYTVEELVQDEKLAKHYAGGTCLVFRLCVNHYHRYAYIDDGFKSENYFIPGVLHTVRPIALKEVPVFSENCREYTLIKTENFGTVLQMEVGAMLVGKIHNLHRRKTVKRGEEKGRFLYGGSTIIVLLQKGKAELMDWMYEATESGNEIPVKMGEQIGLSIK